MLFRGGSSRIALLAACLALNTASPAWAAEVKDGAQLILDFQGSRTGKPYYWLRGTRYTSVDRIPGWTFSRASAGYAEGLIDDVVTNKVTIHNANPTSTAGLTMASDGGGTTLTVVDDAAALAAASLSSVATLGKVYKLDNSTGTGNGLALLTGGVGNMSPHTMSAWLRGTGSVRMRTGQSNTNPITLTSNYVREVRTIQPVNTTERVEFWATPGSIVYFILPQLIERAAPITQDIVNVGTPSSIVVGQIQGLKLFQANEPRITERGFLVEEARTNSAAYSDDLTNAWWTKAGVAVDLVSDPVMGTVSRVTNNSQQAIAVVHRPALFATDGQIVTRSAYVKNNGATDVALRSFATSGTGVIAVSFNFTTENFATSGAGVLASGFGRLAGGWYRLWFTSAVSAADSLTQGWSVRLPNSATDPIGSGVLVRFAQGEAGNSVSSPIATNGAAATRAADSAYVAGLGAILGQFRTNLTRWSADTSNADWAGVSVSKVTGQPDPFGGNGASLIQGTGGAATHYLQAPPTAFVAGTTYTLSRHVKAGTHSLVQLTGNISVFTSSGYANFDLAAGTVTAQNGLAAPASITSVGAGWYRIAITVLAGGSQTIYGGSLALITSPTSPRSESNSLTTSVYDTGAQTEAGGLTDFIVTGASPASAGNPFTLVAWAEIAATDGVDRVTANASDFNGGNYAALRRDTGNAIVSRVQAGSAPATINPTPSFGGKTGGRTLKSALRLRPGTISVAADGALSSPGSLSQTPSGLDRLYLGSLPNGGLPLNGYVQRIIIAANDNDSFMLGQVA